MIKLPVAETVFALFCSRRPQDCRQRVAEINGADFAPFCRSHFGCVPCSVMRMLRRTVRYCSSRLISCQVKPRYFPDTEARRSTLVSHRQQGGVIFCLENSSSFWNCSWVIVGILEVSSSLSEKIYRFLLPAPQLHILHRVKGNQFFRENRKAEGILQHRREQEHISFAHGL